jgi:hypothetical protein
MGHKPKSHNIFRQYISDGAVIGTFTSLAKGLIATTSFMCEDMPPIAQVPVKRMV